MAVQAYVLVRCQAGKAPEVVQELRQKKHVIRANTVFGDYDAVVRVAIRELLSVQHLQEVIFEEIQATKGVSTTSTHIVTSNDPELET